jgi:hypothetical protein
MQGCICKQLTLTLDIPQLCQSVHLVLCVSSQLEQAQYFLPAERSSPCPFSSVLYVVKMFFVKLKNKKMKSSERQIKTYSYTEARDLKSTLATALSKGDLSVNTMGFTQWFHDFIFVVHVQKSQNQHAV